MAQQQVELRKKICQAVEAEILASDKNENALEERLWKV
jgi:hypothetical protein